MLLLAMVVGVVSFPAIGAESGRRFLLLHNSYTTSGAFPNSPTAKGAKDFLFGVPRRVDANSVLVPPNWQYSGIEATFDDGWWKGDFDGLEQSIAKIEDAIDTYQTTGIIGHEQGATAAAIVAARAALGEGPQIKFAVCCGALMPTKGPYADLFERLRATDAALTVPTLHCLSKSSSVCEESEQLAECFGPSARLLWHDNGDALPSSSWWEETQGFPEKSIGGNRWVTQYAGPFYYPDRMTRMRSS